MSLFESTFHPPPRQGTVYLVCMLYVVGTLTLVTVHDTDTGAGVGTVAATQTLDPATPLFRL